MDGPKTCFVISPLGEVGTEVRSKADDLYELIIIPALEVYGFEVVRGDKIIGSGEINSEVIWHVQNAELCIIDLTGHNANVFYECGRRHEAAKPFIQLIEVGETLPFDVAGIRTIPYDLSSSRSTHQAIQEIRRHVEQFEQTGYPSSTSGVSTTTLAEGMERLERKLDRLLGARPATTRPVAMGEMSAPSLDNYLESPHRRMERAIAEQNPAAAVAALVDLRRVSNDPAAVLEKTALLAGTGYEEVADIIRDMLSNDEVDGTMFDMAVGNLVRFHLETDREQEGIEDVKRYVAPALEDDAVDPERKAYLANQMQRILYGAREFEEAQRYALRAISLNPEEIAYRYNLSMIYEARGLMDLAEQVTDEFMAMDVDKDPDHLRQAIDIYLERGRTADVKSLYERLRELDPSAARYKAMMSAELRAVVAES